MSGSDTVAGQQSPSLKRTFLLYVYWFSVVRARPQCRSSTNRYLRDVLKLQIAPLQDMILHGSRCTESCQKHALFPGDNWHERGCCNALEMQV